MNDQKTPGPVSGLVDRLKPDQVSRRRLLQRTAGAGLTASAVASALARPAKAAPGQRGARFRTHQADQTTLVIADKTSGDQWLYLDPGRFYEINSAAAMNVIYETLYHLPDGTQPTMFEPLLATEMPQVSDDGKEVTITLRSGVRFHNSGNVMTAADWVFSWNRLKNVNGNGAFLATSYWDAVEAVDDTTLRITLKAPNAALVPILSSIPLSVMDSKVLPEHGGSDAADAADTDTAADWINEGNSAGTGPYRLVQWDKDGETIIERHPDYWGEAPTLERIIWRSVDDANTQLQLVQSGEVDIAYSLDPDNASVVQDDENLQLAEGPTMAIEYLALHTQEDVGGPLANKAVRQAIGHAIDYDGIITGLMGGAAVKPATIVPLPLLGSEEVQAIGYTLDLAKAQELFDSAGLGEAEITLSYGSDDIGQGGLAVEPLAVKLKSDLEQIDGLTVNLNPMDSETRLADYRAGKLQATISPWTPDYPDVHTYAEPFGHSGDQGTAARRVGYGNPQVDQWLDAGIAELDPEARKQLYVDIQTALVEDAPFLVLYQPVDRKPARKVVQGFAPHPVYIMQLRGVSKTG